MGLLIAVFVAALAAEPFIPEPPPAKPKPDQVIDLSEMDELRAEVRALKAENKKLLEKIDELIDELAAKRPGDKAAPAKAGAKGQPAPPHRNWSRIEVGMTRADVDKFISSHRNLKLISVSASSGVAAVQEEVVTRREGNIGATVVRRGGRTDSRDLGPGAVDNTQQAIDEKQKQTVERKVRSGKTEIITVAQMGTYRTQTGSQPNSLGGSSPTYGVGWREVGRLRIVLTEDVVTAIDGEQH